MGEEQTGRSFATREQLAGIAAAAFGTRRRLSHVVRLPVATKKGVYRLRFDDDVTALLYLWHADENYWPPESPARDAGSRLDPFSDATGADLFGTHHAYLRELGVRVPRLYLLDRGHTHYPADLALVEDVQGEDLEQLMRRDPAAARPALIRLARAVRTLHEHRSAQLGKVAVVCSGEAPPDSTCAQVVRERSERQLAAAAAVVPQLAVAEDRLTELIAEGFAAVRPRDGHGLIHGELDPGHVLIDRSGAPVLIDIEGLMFFDIEWEHVFLQLRFGDYYPWLRRDDLDRNRLRLYRIALHLSLVAGPMRLAQDHPLAADLRGIVAYNLERLLSYVR